MEPKRMRERRRGEGATEVRWTRVLRLREAIQQGRYRVPAEVLAERLMEVMTGGQLLAEFDATKHAS
jgi:anti-sigma28 factor (negative regulator of flagellin synthesis)